MADIAAATALWFDLRPEQLADQIRTSHRADARMIAMYLCRQMTGASYGRIAIAFRRRQQTAEQAIKRAAVRVEANSLFRANVNALRAEIERRHDQNRGNYSGPLATATQ